MSPIARPERGRYLYHYTTREAAFEHILPQRRLRMSSYALMRDPNDAKDWTFRAAYFPGHTGHEAFERQYFEVSRIANTFKRHTKLLSLSRDAPDGFEGQEAEGFGMGWARARMWERYAEDHRGVCLAFDRERLTQRAISQLLRIGAEHVECNPVEYSETALDGDRGHAMTVYLDAAADAGDLARRQLREHSHALFFRKTIEWETEYEVRVIGTTESGDYITFDFDDCLELVIVGDRFPPVGLPGAAMFCEALDVEVKQFRWTDSRPFLFPLTEFGDQQDLREAFARYRQFAGQTDEPLPPFTPRGRRKPESARG